MSANATAVGVAQRGGGVGTGLSQAWPGTLAPRAARIDAACAAKTAPSAAVNRLAVLLLVLAMVLLAGVLWLPMAPGVSP